MKKVYIQDVTLRDGQHAIKHQYSKEKMTEIALALAASKARAISVIFSLLYWCLMAC